MTPRAPVDTQTLPSGATSTSPAPLTLANRCSDEKARGGGHFVNSFVIGTLLAGVGVAATVGAGVGVGTGVGETRVAGVIVVAELPHANRTSPATSATPARALRLGAGTTRSVSCVAMAPGVVGNVGHAQPPSS